MRSAEPAQDVVERLARHRRIEPAQHVVGAERDDDAVGLVRHRPVEAGEAVGGGIAGDAGVGHLGRNALGLQRRLQPDRKRLVGRQPEPGGQRIAQRHDPDRPLLRRWPTAENPQIGRGDEQSLDHAPEMPI